MFVWIRGGEVVNSGERVSLQDQGSCLFIFPVALSDAGLYTCNISNVIFGECFSETYDIRMDVQSELYRVSCCYCIQLILLVYVYISQALFLVLYN